MKTPKTINIQQNMTSLEKSINKLIQQHNKYPTNYRQLEKECKRLVKHANHILHTLVAKRISLGYAITAFEQASKDYIEEFSKCTKQGQDGSDTQRVILTNWFTHFLRLRGMKLYILFIVHYLHPNI